MTSKKSSHQDPAQRDFLFVIDSKKSKTQKPEKKETKQPNRAKRKSMTEEEVMAAKRKLIDHLHRYGF